MKRFLNRVLPNAWLIEPNEIGLVMKKHRVVLMFAGHEDRTVAAAIEAKRQGFKLDRYAPCSVAGDFSQFLAKIEAATEPSIFIIDTRYSMGFRVRRPSAVICSRKQDDQTLAQAQNRVRNGKPVGLYLL